LIASVAAAACQRTVEPAAAPALRSAVEVSIVAPAWREMPRTLEVSGTLYADEEVLVATKVAGRVQSVHLDFGDEAAGGALLVQVDPTDYALALAESEASLAQALAVLGLRALPEGEFAADATPAVRKALAARDLAAERRARAERLAATQPPVISEQELTDARAVLAGMEAEVEVQRQAAHGALAQAELIAARLRTSAQRVADAAHRAPATEPAARFRVAERRVAAGDYVAVGAPLFRLVDGDPLRLRVRIPERHLPELAEDQEASVRIESAAHEYRGAVARVAPEIDRATRTFTVELSVPNPDGALLPGGFAAATLRTGTVHALTIPAGCVRRFAGVHKVLRVRDGIVEERRVELGAQDGEWIEVRSGVEEGDALVLAPDPALVTGSAVRARASESPDASPR
jgi:RND family efflux transporter MFP subunit